MRGDQPVPVAVKTGLTDLEYSEIVSGLEPGDRVLLLPSTSLYEQQERLQEFINQRFGSTRRSSSRSNRTRTSGACSADRRPVPRERRFDLPGLSLAAESGARPASGPSSLARLAR